jgi:hypothetical protein
MPRLAKAAVLCWQAAEARPAGRPGTLVREHQCPDRAGRKPGPHDRAVRRGNTGGGCVPSWDERENEARGGLERPPWAGPLAEGGEGVAVMAGRAGTRGNCGPADSDGQHPPTPHASRAARSSVPVSARASRGICRAARPGPAESAD